MSFMDYCFSVQFNIGNRCCFLSAFLCHFPEAAAERASKKWKNEDPTYSRMFENGHVGADKKSLDTQKGKNLQNFSLQRVGRGKLPQR